MPQTRSQEGSDPIEEMDRKVYAAFCLMFAAICFGLSPLDEPAGPLSRRSSDPNVI
jgi:hypothetical protein